MKEELAKVSLAARRLKVFPLPSAVLLPGGALPLHIFEPRYRAMVQDALASDRVFAMAQVQPGQESQLAGSPALEPIVCAGVVGYCEELEDGRFELLLTGVVRARIISELPRHALYREMECEVISDPPGPAEGEPALRSALLELMARLPSDEGQRLAQITGQLQGGFLADVVAAAIIEDVVRRQELLEQLDVPRRVADVTEEVLELVARIRPPNSSGYLN